MKKRILLAGLVMALLAGCNSNNKKNDTPSVDNTTTQQTTVDIHNAQNALDYEGVYEGTLPTASGSGMKVAITLSEGVYQKSVEYIGENDKPHITKGRYSWDGNGSVITLLNEDASGPNKYFVAENKIYQLDMNGNRITGAMAEEYALKKQ